MKPVDFVLDQIEELIVDFQERVRTYRDTLSNPNTPYAADTVGKYFAQFLARMNAVAAFGGANIDHTAEYERSHSLASERVRNNLNATKLSPGYRFDLFRTVELLDALQGSDADDRVQFMLEIIAMSDDELRARCKDLSDEQFEELKARLPLLASWMLQGSPERCKKCLEAQPHLKPKFWMDEKDLLIDLDMFPYALTAGASYRARLRDTGVPRGSHSVSEIGYASLLEYFEKNISLFTSPESLVQFFLDADPAKRQEIMPSLTPDEIVEFGKTLEAAMKRQPNTGKSKAAPNTTDDQGALVIELTGHADADEVVSILRTLLTVASDPLDEEPQDEQPSSEEPATTQPAASEATT